jgi:hypothetical protein
MIVIKLQKYACCSCRCEFWIDVMPYQSSLSEIRFCPVCKAEGENFGAAALPEPRCEHKFAEYGKPDKRCYLAIDHLGPHRG